MKDHDAQFDSLLPPLRLDRRGFMATTVAAGFSLAAGTAVAQTAITTDAKGLVTGKIDIPTSDGKIPAFRAAPDGKRNLPTLIVVQEIFGVHEYIQDVCRRLAHQGYLAIAPELYARQGDPSKYTEIPKLQAEVVSKVPDKQVIADLDATAAWAAANGGNPDRLGILGFCWGGRQVWLYAAHNPKLKAGAAWYGHLAGDPTELKPKSALAIVNDLKAPVLGAYGGKDAGISQADVDRMRIELAKGSAAAKASRIDIYPDAGHAFHADYRPSYRKSEAEQSWTRMLDWFKQNGV
jgi:carboxymethylenebutenolidase